MASRGRSSWHPPIGPRPQPQKTKAVAGRGRCRIELVDGYEYLNIQLADYLKNVEVPSYSGSMVMIHLRESISRVGSCDHPEGHGCSLNLHSMHSFPWNGGQLGLFK